MEHVVPNGFDSKHSYYIMISFNLVQYMPNVSTEIITYIYCDQVLAIFFYLYFFFLIFLKNNFYGDENYMQELI